VPFYPDTGTVKVTGNPSVARLISGSPVAIHPCTAIPKSRHPDKSWFQFHRLPVSKDPFPVFIPVPFDPDKTLLVRRSPESPDMDACGVPVTWYPGIIQIGRGGVSNVNLKGIEIAIFSEQLNLAEPDYRVPSQRIFYLGCVAGEGSNPKDMGVFLLTQG